MSRKKIDNYAAFYALLKKMPGADKEQLVETFTLGRTSSLREMNPGEYKAMIAATDTRRTSIWCKCRQNLSKKR